MIYRRSTQDILAEVVADMNCTTQIVSFTSTATAHTLVLTDIMYAEAGRNITIGGESFKITSIDEDTNTIVLGMVDGATVLPPITDNEFEFYRPYFFYGTPINVDNELQDIQNAANKTPMIYLLMEFSERVFDDDENVIDRESTTQLFFLTQADFDSKTTAQMLNAYVRPMRRLQQMFIAHLKSLPGLFDMDDFVATLRDRVKFGVTVTTKGTTRSWFADNLSGVEMQSTLRIRKSYLCDTARAMSQGVGHDIIGNTLIVYS